MIEYRIENGLEVLEWYRDINGDRKIKINKNFEPYFFVDYDAKIPNDGHIKRVDETDFRGLKGEKLKKIVTTIPSAVSKLREYFPRTWEADVPFTDRFRIDVGTKPFDNPRIMFIDIETMDLNINSLNPILSIAIYDNYSKKFYIYTWKNDYNMHQEKDNKELLVVDNEDEMLQRFIMDFKKFNPDIITGWNSNKFDLPYLHNRLNKCKLKGESLSPLRGTRIRNGELNIRGRICFDLLNAYKRIHEGEMESFRLGDVAEEELGHGKEGSALGVKYMHKHDLKKLIKYNVRDVEILVELDEKLKIFDFYFKYAEKTNASLSDVYFNSKLVDMYLLSRCHQNKIALPTKNYLIESVDKIKGAKVLEPTPGLYNNLAVFDVKSLYPSIIITFNMSPETCNDFMDFNRDEPGILPEALLELFAERQRLKDAGMDDQQRVVKELMNSFYGVMIYSGFRLSRKEVGESITYVGRRTIEWMSKIAKEAGYDVEYGDTDSIFVSGIETPDEALLLQNRINKSFDEFINEFGLNDHRFVVEFENFVETMLFTGKKKRYAMKTDSGYKIRGFEVRRSNAQKLGRQIQEQVLKLILNKRDENVVRKVVDDARLFTKHMASLEEIGIPATIQKDLENNNGQHARAARYSNEFLGTTFENKEKLLLIYLKQVPMQYPLTDVIAIKRGMELKEGFIIDYDKHIERGLDKLIEPIFDVMGWQLKKETKSLFDC